MPGEHITMYKSRTKRQADAMHPQQEVPRIHCVLQPCAKHRSPAVYQCDVHCSLRDCTIGLYTDSISTLAVSGTM